MEFPVEKALQQASVAQKEGKLEDAERCYRGILNSPPPHANANHNLGVLAVSCGKVEAALPLFKVAIKANRKNGQFWISYIDALSKLEKFDACLILIILKFDFLCLPYVYKFLFSVFFKTFFKF